MTTNHRPTLESKRGRDIAIRDTIQHARSTKGQTSLKLRSDITGAQIHPLEGKEALRELDGERKRQKRDEPGIPKSGLNDDVLDKSVATSSQSKDIIDSRDTSNVVAPLTSVSKIPQGTKNTKKEINVVSENRNISTTNDSEVSGSEDSDSDDDETKALILELKKVKDEKEKRLNKGLDSSKFASGVPNANSKEGSKRSWRGTSAFSRGQASTEKAFTTDTLNSSTHKQFLSKYFR